MNSEFSSKSPFSPSLSSERLNSSSSNPSSPSLVRDTLATDLHTQLIELQRENARLQKDIEAKETKLNSSMRSIKMFWSPELKKERAARKAEAEKFARLKEQFNVVSEESQQRTEIIQDLQIQLKQCKEGSEASTIRKSSTASSHSFLSSQEDIHREVETLRQERERQENESYVLQKSLDELSIRLENQQQAIKAKDETIARLMEMLQNKGQVSDSGKKEEDNYKKKLAEVVSEVEHLRDGISERDRAITALQEEMDHLRISNVSEELQQSANMLAKESQIADLTHQVSILEQQIADLKANSSISNEDKKQAEVYQSHSQFLKAKVESLKSEVAKKEAALGAAETKLDTFKAHQSDQQQHISVLQSSLQAKDHHIKNLQSELESLRVRLDEREASLKNQEKQMQSMSSEHSENSFAVENLKSVIETKERQLATLRERCETLHTEIGDKEATLASTKGQLAALRAEHQDSASTISSLEATIRDKDRYIEMLQAQRQRSGKEQQEEVSTVQRNYERLESRLEVMKEEKSRLEETISTHRKELIELKSSVKEKDVRLDVMEQKNARLERDLEKSVDSKEELASELSSKKLEVSKLEKELRTAMQDLDNSKVQKENEKSETILKLKADIQAKDEQIEELERQLKEQNKKLTTIKRNQQLEREKQAQLLNDVKKQGNEHDERVDEIRKELKTKEERIAVLEEALTESVTIAAEREELLAQQANSAESATQRVEDIETELERSHIEMAITNTKNASLLLALNENDAILNYYKSERRHMVEEVLEMRQNALLATISEKDANIALLEIGPTKNSEQEVAILKREKDKLVTELKDQVLDAVGLIEDSMEKLQLYGEDLLDVAKNHFPDVVRKLSKPPPRDYGKYENIINDASQKERLAFLETLEKDMQALQDYVHKLLELIEESSE
ncbi:ELKS/Rab6-interacting/CAST family member 1 isoform X2 [Nematostella vectensis]|uniref:ELKS/Rab6-interacting/CAST family member 1 isoform X2 n=1 Tax=Nematostella vectensis TaxID=45351 RepID=UPI0020776AE0|nr:ELKS/Rab6-interacting/CAST family member 1 isoform X2 [Nematostella vectensis]